MLSLDLQEIQRYLELTEEDWVRYFTQLSYAELGVLVLVRILNSQQEGVEISIQEMAEELGLHPGAVWKSLINLHNQKFLSVEYYNLCPGHQEIDLALRDRFLKKIGIALGKESLLNASHIKGWNPGLAELLTRFEVTVKFEKEV